MIDDTERCCRTCRYGEADKLCDRICVNADSERCADWVGNDDTCEEWEANND